MGKIFMQDPLYSMSVLGTVYSHMSDQERSCLSIPTQPAHHKCCIGGCSAMQCYSTVTGPREMRQSLQIATPEARGSNCEGRITFARGWAEGNSPAAGCKTNQCEK